MVAAAQESKRLGLCQKSMFVVPNHLVGQWASEYLRLYPSANILVTTKQDFETGNRKKFCGRIATGDYDAVIIGHSQFEKIPMSIERQREQLEKQLDDIERGIDDVQASKGEQFTVKQLMKTRKAIKTKLEKLNDTKRKDTVIDFEQLGVDRLFIDESHFYKNLYLYTKMRNVGGIAQTEAQKSSDLFMKCRYLDEITGNRGTVFATGTPVSNSMVELYSVQRYLQYDTLAQNGLQHFDSWASTFGETVTALELAPEGTNYRAKTRFAKFYNLPELMQMFREAADIQTADMLKLPVPKVNYHNIKTKPSEIQTEMVASLAKRAEKVRARLVEPNIDNMLKITNDGRKLALDQRMIDPMLPDEPDSKVNVCVDNVYRIWEEHAATKATQLVFCDLSTPKNDGTFNVYDDMREKLIARGIPAGQIRFIHEATTDAQKKELFGKVRSGEVRVLFGSTPKMGAGTNVQDRLIAIHNLDCPWRPSDLEQRQGRIERQGNMFPEVEVYRYVTEQTFDAYLYQLVESKQKFISQIMTSKSPVRSAEDVDEVALSFAEVKMLATGDARFKEKMDLDIQVSKLRVLKQSYLSEHYDLEDRVLKYYPQTIKEYEERIAGYENDAALSLVIILLIAPVFSGEYGGVDNIILTSKYGKTKCATAKVLASLLSAVFITTLVVIFNLLIAVAIYGTEGLDCSILFAPIDFLEGYIPFNITCGTVLKYQILLAFMSAISVTGIVLILSAVCKSQMIAFVISAAIHVIPIMLPISETSALYRIIVLMPLFYSQYISIMSVEQMHNGMLYAVWSIPVAIALVVIGSIISHKAFSKHQVR